jgi:hypothetical protein
MRTLARSHPTDVPPRRDQVRPTGGACCFPRVHFQPKLKAYLEEVAAAQPRAEGDLAEGGKRPLIEVFCEDLVVKQGMWTCSTSRRRLYDLTSSPPGVLLLPGTCFDDATSDHFRLGFGRLDMSTALDKLRSYLSSILDA